MNITFNTSHDGFSVITRTLDWYPEIQGVVVDAAHGETLRQWQHQEADAHCVLLLDLESDARTWMDAQVAIGRIAVVRGPTGTLVMQQEPQHVIEARTKEERRAQLARLISDARVDGPAVVRSNHAWHEGRGAIVNDADRCDHATRIALYEAELAAI